MAIYENKGKRYNVDDSGFLTNFDQWDEDFPNSIASKLKIDKGLTTKHWSVINYIRDTFIKSMKCPNVYETCRANKLRLSDLKELFPTGYLRGACKLSGISYKEGNIQYSNIESAQKLEAKDSKKKVYRVDVRGFLVDPEDWDEDFAFYLALNMKMKDGLTDKHYKILNFLRDYYKKNGEVPIIYETCEANGLELDDFEKLFPDGYHRCAVKLAGLQVK
jgi:tRNA 2-thiouridine synthesizing protein E